MKIWYQSFGSFSHTPNYGKALEAYVRRLGGERLDFEVHGLEYGDVGDQYRVFEYFDTAEIIRNVRVANRQGFDAVAIGNILDPGLLQSREISDIPVLGLCESSLMMACLVARNFSLVTVNERFIPRIEENVRRYGLWERMKGIRTMALQVEDMEEALKKPRLQKRIIKQFLDQARLLIEDGTEALIPAGGFPMLLLALADIHSVDRVPVINGIVSLVNMAEMMVRFREQTGVFISRRLSYASPEQARLDKAKKLYGLE
jgi:allantoin racemase